MHLCTVLLRPFDSFSCVPDTRAILARNLQALLDDRIRKGKYPSVENFAYSHGLVKTNIYRILKKEVSPTLETLDGIAKALNVELRELYPGKGKR